VLIAAGGSAHRGAHGAGMQKSNTPHNSLS
jgi:hypothetical protein